MGSELEVKAREEEVEGVAAWLAAEAIVGGEEQEKGSI